MDRKKIDKKPKQKKGLLKYIPPNLIGVEILVENGIATNSVSVDPVEPNTVVEYEWEDGGEIGGDFSW